MIRGYLSSIASRQRPFVGALFQFPTLGNRQLTVELLIDTGSDRTVLAPLDAMRLGIDVGRLPSVLGRDVLSNFALFFEVRTQRVLLLEPAEAAQIHLA